VIPVRTAFRIMPAAWFGVPITMLAAWYATLLPSPPGYGTAATAAASGALPFIGAFVAACAAWEGSRLRRARIWGGPWARSGLHMAAGLLVGPVAAGLVATTAAVVVAHAGATAFPPDLAIVGVLTLDILAYASIGFALGILAPAALAVPIAAVLPVLWLAFVPAMYPVWLRHLTGMYRDCCSLEQSLAPQAVLASVVLDVAFIATASVACVVSWPRLWRAVGAVGILAAGSLVGIRVASGLTFAPVMPRDASLLSCASGGGSEVCLWPEHAAASTQILATIADVRTRWLAAGIDAPTTFTEASGEHAPGAIEVHLRDPLSKDGVIIALADGMLPPLAGCGRATTGGIAIPYLQAWYAAAGGLSPTSLQGLDAPGDDVNPSILTVVDQLTQANASVRRAWAAKAAAIGQTCEDIAPDLRVGG
jgi:hypothetical protein